VQGILDTFCNRFVEVEFNKSSFGRVRGVLDAFCRRV
jgi:hypothetical protein